MRRVKFLLRLVLAAPLLAGLTGCLGLPNIFGSSEDSVPPAERQLPASTEALLAIKGMTQNDPIFVRIFKEESELEVWKLKNGRFEFFKTYPICAWSGAVGPKVQQGDKQAPEGFYTIGPGQMNPHSLYHLAFNIGFPNAYDRANGHTGSALMIHGDCKSAGCYAMTDAQIEEIYILAREAFKAGQTHFLVDAFPFRMTAENMRSHRDSPWYHFWLRLKEGYDSFEKTHKPPVIKVCDKQYLVNVRFPGLSGDPSPTGACPLYAKIDPNQMPGIDGVPPTLIASLKKEEAPSNPAAPVPGAAPNAAPPVAVAALKPAAPPAHPPRPAGASQAQPAMSASPVITRAAPRPQSIIASLQPSPPVTAKAPAANNQAPYASAALAPATPFKPTAAAPVAKPVNFEPTPQPASLAAPPNATPAMERPATAVAPTKYVDPEALQKPNRAGKGGKLTMPSHQEPLAAPAQPSGAAPSAAGAASAYGFAGQPR